MNKSNDMTGKTEYQAFEKWCKSYFGHGMPPSQSYFESCMSAFQAACEYKDAQYRPRYEETEDAVYIKGKKFYSEKVVKELEKERAKSQRLVDALEHYKGKSLLIQNLSGIARGQVSVFDVVTVYIEEDERWLVGDVAERALAEYKAKEGGE